MIFPSGKPRNNENLGLGETDSSHDPRSPNYVPEFKKKAKKERDRSWEQPAKQTTLDETKHNIIRSAHSIQSARAGNLSDIGGPVRQMKSATANSIWDNNVLDRIKSGEVKLDQGERIAADNKARAEQREESRRAQFTIDKEAVKAAMKGSNTVTNTSAHASDNSNYSTKVSKNQFSIFDKADKFENMSDPTSGEAIKQAAKQRREKSDRSWETQKPNMTAKEKLSSFFDSLRKSQEGK